MKAEGFVMNIFALRTACLIVVVFWSLVWYFGQFFSGRSFTRRMLNAARFGRLPRFCGSVGADDVTGRPRFVGQSHTSFRRRFGQSGKCMRAFPPYIMVDTALEGRTDAARIVVASSLFPGCWEYVRGCRVIFKDDCQYVPS